MPPLCCFSPWKGWQHSEHVLCTRRAGAEYCYIGLLSLMAPTQTHSVNANSALSNVNTLTQGWFRDILSWNALNCPPEAIICRGDYKWITASLFHYPLSVSGAQADVDTTVYRTTVNTNTGLSRRHDNTAADTGRTTAVPCCSSLLFKFICPVAGFSYYFGFFWNVC